MIPTNILMLIFIFTVLFVMGFIATLIVLIHSVKEKKVILSIASIVIMLIYIAFGFLLL